MKITPRHTNGMPSQSQAATMAKGIRRMKDGWDDQDCVLVKYSGGAEVEIPRSQYVAQGHHPPINSAARAVSLSQGPRPRCPRP